MDIAAIAQVPQHGHSVFQNLERRRDPEITRLASAIHVIEFVEILAFQNLGEFLIGAQRNGVTRRQLHGRFGHPAVPRGRLVVQDSEKPFGDQVAKCYTALHRSDFGSFYEVIGKVECATHKYAYMLRQPA